MELAAATRARSRFAITAARRPVSRSATKAMPTTRNMSASSAPKPSARRVRTLMSAIIPGGPLLDGPLAFRRAEEIDHLLRRRARRADRDEAERTADDGAGNHPDLLGAFLDHGLAVGRDRSRVGAGELELLERRAHVRRAAGERRAFEDHLLD